MNRFSMIIGLAALLGLTSISVSQTQTPAKPDSSKAAKKSGLDGPIRYEAAHFINFVKEKKTVLLGQAKVTYQSMTLTAEKITVDWDTKIVVAEGVPDSGWVKTAAGDSTFKPILRGTPQFDESGDVMKGEVMTFNFSTKKGRVVRGRTAYEDGFYNGQAIKMFSRKTLNVADGSYTTCDKTDDPHFHFASSKMKIFVNDKLIAKPVILYVGHIPVFALPFIYFPIQRDRHSGFIIPSYGNSSLEGRYLRGLGYYWAASEYWDVVGKIDYFEKSGFLFQGGLNYNVRYKLNGSISGSWTHKNFDLSNVRERRWDLNVQHNEQFSPTLDLKINGSFVSSGDYYRELSNNRDQRLQRTMVSNATLSKQFGGSQSIQINFNQTRDLTLDRVSETLPEVSFYLGQIALFGRPEPKRGQVPESKWYQSIYVSYSSELTMKHESQAITDQDTTHYDRRSAGWDHRFGVSGSQKLFGWLNFNPSLSVEETWLDRRQDYRLDSLTNTFHPIEHKGFSDLRTFSASASFGSKLYGVFPVFPNAVIRHVATPSVSIVFQPDFSDPRWGYAESLRDTAGMEKRLDRFSGNLFRPTPFGGQQAMRFDLNNLFQMKIKQGEKEKKFDLFTWNLSTAYNWKAAQYKFSDLYSRIQANPVSNMSLAFGSTYSFYRTDSTGQPVNRLFWEGTDWDNWPSLRRLRIARLTNLTASMTLNLQGKMNSAGKGTPSAAAPAMLPVAGALQPNRFEMDDRPSQIGGPWSFSATLNYSENRSNPLNPSRQFWADGSFKINLTKSWNVSYSAHMDLLKHEMISQDFIFHRDLHCWEGTIIWSPTGYKRFYVRVNVKSNILKDLKIEKGSGQQGIYGY